MIAGAEVFAAMGKHRAVTLDQCPCCKHGLNATICVETGMRHVQKAGDITVCLFCVAPLHPLERYHLNAVIADVTAIRAQLALGSGGIP